MGGVIYRGVIGIDPGITTGWAIFRDATLLEAGTVKAEGIPDGLPDVVLLPAIVVIEVPRIYPRGGKGDQNDLIDLAVCAGTINGWYMGLSPDTATRLVTPRAWKGTVPKRIHQERLVAALTPEERARLPKRPRARTFDHNMLDAVGLALHQLGREQQR